MIEFFDTYKIELLYLLVIVSAIILSYFLTNVLARWLIRQEQKLFPGNRSNAVTLVKRILNSLWIALGVMAVIALFFGETYIKFRYSFRLVLYLGIVAVITIVLASSVNIWFKRTVEYKIKVQDDPTTFKFLRYVAVFFVYAIGTIIAFMAFPSLRGVTQTALGGAGILALIAGVASQEALANLSGGVFIITFKPFKIGDRIKVTDSMVGTVTDITLRHTVIRNFENKMIVIPNAMINREKLINYDLGELKICERIEIAISYDSDVELAKKIVRDECEKHPFIIDNRSAKDIHDGKPMVRVALTELNDWSVTIRAWAWASNFSQAFEMRCDLFESIKKRFENEGIEIPFPYRTLVFKDKKGPVEKEP